MICEMPMEMRRVVRELIAGAVRGRAPDARGHKLLMRAFTAYPDAYAALHREVKAEAAAELNPLHGGSSEEGS